MKRMIKGLGWIMVLSMVACSLPGQVESTPALHEITTPEPHQAEFTHTPMEMPTAAVTATPTFAVTPTNTTAASLLPEISDLLLPIAYVDQSADPPAMVLLDPLNGNEVHRISAVGLSSGSVSTGTQSGFFFIDENLEQVHRLLLDGTVEVLDFLNPDGGPFEGVVLPSPSGERVAHTVVRYDDVGGGDVKLVIFNVDGSGEQILLDEYVPTRPTRPTPIKWSADGQHLYYMHVIENVGGYGGMDLHRIEIFTGISEEIFANADCLCTTSISPDERYAARVLDGQPLTLVIKELETGSETRLALPPDYFYAWEMVWAPDSSELLISVWGYEGNVDIFSILDVSLEDLEVNVLVTDDQRFLQPVAWHVMETIWLNDDEGNLWHMDADSREMTITANDAWVISYSR